MLRNIIHVPDRYSNDNRTVEMDQLMNAATTDMEHDERCLDIMDLLIQYTENSNNSNESRSKDLVQLHAVGLELMVRLNMANGFDDDFCFFSAFEKDNLSVFSYPDSEYMIHDILGNYKSLLSNHFVQDLTDMVLRSFSEVRQLNSNGKFTRASLISTINYVGQKVQDILQPPLTQLAGNADQSGDMDSMEMDLDGSSKLTKFVASKSKLKRDAKRAASLQRRLNTSIDPASNDSSSKRYAFTAGAVVKSKRRKKAAATGSINNSTEVSATAPTTAAAPNANLSSKNKSGPAFYSAQCSISIPRPANIKFIAQLLLDDGLEDHKFLQSKL